MKTKLACAAGAAAGFVLLTTSANAQDKDLSTPVQEFVIEDIVVTARKRDEGLQDTPISITALTAEGLEGRGVVGIDGIAASTPNLQLDAVAPVSGNNAAGTVFLRGIGQIDFTLNTDPGVGIYVDGVYVARSVGSIFDLADIQRIEVLRGPQGTLFGRNTIGGAISITTNRPDDVYSGSLEATLGSFDRLDIKGTVNVPISDQLFARISLMSRDRAGYVRRALTGERLGDDNKVAARAALRWLPTPELTVDLAFDYMQAREQGAANTPVFLNENSVFGGFHNGVLSGAPAICTNPADPARLSDNRCFNQQWVTRRSNGDESFATLPSRSELDLWGAVLNTEWQLSDTMTIRSITGYRDVNSIGIRDADHSPLRILETTEPFDDRQFSQEVQLNGSAVNDRLNWLLGAYYFNESGSNIGTISFSALDIRSGGSAKIDSYALFSQMTFDLTDRLSLTAGIRLTDETRKFRPSGEVIADYGLGIPVGTPLTPTTERISKINSEWTPMATIAYRFSDAIMAYATYSEGFKAGGFVQRVLPPQPALPEFKPEFAKVFEVGFKTDLFDRHLRLNASAFQTDYSDIQINAFLNAAPVTQNAASATIKGAELEFTLLPTDTLLIEGGVGYLDAGYDSLGPTVDSRITLNSEFPKAPRWSLNAGIAYKARLAGDFVLTPRVDWNYHSTTFQDAINSTVLKQPAYHAVNASLRLAVADRWSLTARVTNLTDERHIVSGYAELPFVGVSEVVRARPREWSLTAKVSW